MALVRIQHTSMEFSDSVEQHRHDAKVIFDRAVAKKVWACTGTEAGGARSNHDLRDQLIVQAHAHEFYIYAHPNGEWVACNRALMRDFDKGYAGPFIKAKGGKASQGAHAARGVTWVQGAGKDASLGRMTFGSAHYLTNRSEAASRTSNEPLIRGIAEWGKKMGGGSKIVFLGADANTNDKALDVFNGRPFTTAADELKRHEPTHGPHSYIDIIASYDHDGRVKAKSFESFTDKEFFLYTDHYMIEAIYEVGEIRTKKA